MSTPSATTDTRIPSTLSFPKPLHRPITCSKCKTTFSVPPTIPQWTCPKCDVKVWQDYDSAKTCAVCNSPLGIGNRHHCHRCGSCVCGDCGQYMMHLTNNKKDKDRVCKGCAFPPLQETTLSGFLTKVSKDAKTGKETGRNLRNFEVRKNILMYTTDRTTTWKSFFVLDGVEVVGGLKEDAACGFTIQLPSSQHIYNPSFAQHGPLHLISDKESEAQKWMNAIGQAAVVASSSSSLNDQYYIDDQTRKQMTQQAFAQKQNIERQQQQQQHQNNNSNNNNIDNDSLASSQQQMVGTIHKFDKDVTPSVEGMLIKIGAKSAGARNERHFRLFDRYLQYAEGDRKKSPNAKDEFDIFGAEVTTVSDKEEPALLSKGDCGIKIDKGPFMKRCPLILVASNSTSRNRWIVALQAATGNPHQQQYNNNYNNLSYGNNNNNYRSPSPIRRVGGDGEMNNNNNQQHQTRNYESPDRNNYPKLIDRLHVKIEISQDRRRRDPAMFDLWNDQIVTFNSLDSSNTSLEDLIKLVENVVFDGRNALNLGFEGILLVPGKLIAYRQSLFPVDDAENISATLRDLEDLRGDDESAGLFHKLGDYTFLDEIPLYAEDTIIWRDMFTLESLMKRNYFSSPQSNANTSSMLRSDRNRKILTVQDESYIVNKSTGRYDDNDNDNDSVVNAGTPPPLSVEDYNNRYHIRSPPSPQTPRRQYDDFDVNHRTVSPPRNQQHSNYYPRPPLASSSHDSPYVSPQRSPRNSSNMNNNLALPPESNIVSPSRRSTSPVMLMNQIHQHEQQQRRYHEQLSFVREQQQQRQQANNNNNNNMTSPSLISVSESRVISSPTNYRGLPVKSIIPSTRNWITAAYPHHPDPYRDPPSKAELLAESLENFGNNKSY